MATVTYKRVKFNFDDFKEACEKAGVVMEHRRNNPYYCFFRGEEPLPIPFNHDALRSWSEKKGCMAFSEAKTLELACKKCGIDYSITDNPDNIIVLGTYQVNVGFKFSHDALADALTEAGATVREVLTAYGIDRNSLIARIERKAANGWMRGIDAKILDKALKAYGIDFTVSTEANREAALKDRDTSEDRYRAAILSALKENAGTYATANGILKRCGMPRQGKPLEVLKTVLADGDLEKIEIDDGEGKVITAYRLKV